MQAREARPARGFSRWVAFVPTYSSGALELIPMPIYVPIHVPIQVPGTWFLF